MTAKRVLIRYSPLEPTLTCQAHPLRSNRQKARRQEGLSIRKGGKGTRDAPVLTGRKVMIMKKDAVMVKGEDARDAPVLMEKKTRKMVKEEKDAPEPKEKMVREEREEKDAPVPKEKMVKDVKEEKDVPVPNKESSSWRRIPSMLVTLTSRPSMMTLRIYSMTVVLLSLSALPSEMREAEASAMLSSRLLNLP